MAKVTIAGNSYVITSDVSMADLEAVKKYRPSALTITDPETKETLFKVGVGSSSITASRSGRGPSSGDNEFTIEDVFVYPQEVTGSTTGTDQAAYTEWLYELDDDTFNTGVCCFEQLDYLRIRMSSSGYHSGLPAVFRLLRHDADYKRKQNYIYNG